MIKPEIGLECAYQPEREPEESELDVPLLAKITAVSDDLTEVDIEADGEEIKAVRLIQPHEAAPRAGRYARWDSPQQALALAEGRYIDPFA